MSMTSFSAVSRTSRGGSRSAATAPASCSATDSVKLLEPQLAQDADEAREQRPILDDREPALHVLQPERGVVAADLGGLVATIVAPTPGVMRRHEHEAAVVVGGGAPQREG